MRTESYEDYAPWQRLQARTTELSRQSGRRLWTEMDTDGLNDSLRKSVKGANTYRLYNDKRVLLCRGVPNKLLGFAEGWLWRSFNEKLGAVRIVGRYNNVVLDENNVVVYKMTGPGAFGFVKGAEAWLTY